MPLCRGTRRPAILSQGRDVKTAARLVRGTPAVLETPGGVRGP